MSVLQGVFTFQRVVVSDDYVVSFSLPGFRTLTHRHVKVAADKDATEDAIMLAMPTGIILLSAQ